VAAPAAEAPRPMRAKPRAVGWHYRRQPAFGLPQAVVPLGLALPPMHAKSSRQLAG